MGAAPPAYAWDWLARHHLVWREVRDRLVAAGPHGGTPSERPAAPVRRPAGDVPDWSRDHPDLVGTVSASDGGTSGSPPRPQRDYRPLDTRTEVIAALRADYPEDVAVREVVDAVVEHVAFLGRLDVPLPMLGVRSAPRGMRWWWERLSGATLGPAPSAVRSSSEPAPMVPLQLRLMDVLAGFGDD